MLKIVKLECLGQHTWASFCWKQNCQIYCRRAWTFCWLFLEHMMRTVMLHAPSTRYELLVLHGTVHDFALLTVTLLCLCTLMLWAFPWYWHKNNQNKYFNVIVELFNCNNRQCHFAVSKLCHWLTMWSFILFSCLHTALVFKFKWFPIPDMELRKLSFLEVVHLKSNVFFVLTFSTLCWLQV